MIPIQPIGRYWQLDAEGYLMNDAGEERIAPRWRPVLARIVAICTDRLGEELHSLYLRGSVARGMEVDGCSDLDCFALVHRPVGRWQPAGFAESLAVELRARFDFVSEVELMLESLPPDPAALRLRLAFIIKTQSVSLYGHDMASLLPRYKPSAIVGFDSRWLVQDVTAFLAGRLDSRAMMKLLLRCGLELVVRQEGRYSSDLYCCYEAFARYFPDQAEPMRQCLHFYLNPHSELDKQRQLVRTLAKWMEKMLMLQ